MTLSIDASNLTGWLTGQRWFGSKARELSAVNLLGEPPSHLELSRPSREKAKLPCFPGGILLHWRIGSCTVSVSQVAVHLTARSSSVGHFRQVWQREQDGPCAGA